MGAFSTWTERIDAGLRLTVPYGFMLILMMFNTLTIPELLQSNIKLPLLLMALYYWAIYRPTLVPVWLAFIAGAALDFIMGLPLGLNALVFVLVQWSVTDQRRYLMGQSFVMIWLGFALVAASATALQWVIFGLVSSAWVSLQPQFWTLLVSYGIFPFIYGLLHLTHKILPLGAASSRYVLKRQSRYKGAKG